MTTGLLVLASAVVAWGQAPAPPPYKLLKYPPLGQVKIPEIVTFTLPNGMQVYLLENRELPLISGFALVRTGNLFEPADKVGLAYMTGAVMRTGGTREKTGDQIDELLENMAASVESGIGETSGTVSFSALRENVDDVLEVFRDLLTAPEFRQDKIDLVKTQLRGSIQRRNDNADGIPGRELNDILYGRDTPYGRRMEYEHVDRIQRDDLRAFYRRYFFPANILLAVQGDFSAPAMRASIEKLFAGWNEQQPAVPPFPPVQPAYKPGLHLAEKEDVEQTFFALGHLGGQLKDPDYPALEVMGDILGGGFSSRLFRKVRTELGIAYSVGGGWGANYHHPGIFQITGSVNADKTAEALQVVRQEVERMRTAEVSAEELETAKSTVLNSFVFRFDRPSKTLNRLVTYDYYGYPKDFLFRYQKALAGLTRADILRVARQYLRPGEMVVVVCGKPASLAQLASLGLPVEKIDLSIAEPKRERPAASTASLQAGRDLLARAQQAMGGPDRLAGIADYVKIAEATLHMMGPGLKAKQVTRWKAPSAFRQEQVLPFGNLLTYSDGRTGWMIGPQGRMPMPPEVLRQVQTELFRSLPGLVLSDRDSSRTVTATGEATVEVAGTSGIVVKLVLDPRSGLPAKQIYASPNGQGEVEDLYEDWKDVGGVKLPHKTTTSQAGRTLVEVVVQEWRLNTGVSADDLSRTP